MTKDAPFVALIVCSFLFLTLFFISINFSPPNSETFWAFAGGLTAGVAAVVIGFISFHLNIEMKQKENGLNLLERQKRASLRLTFTLDKFNSSIAACIVNAELVHRDVVLKNASPDAYKRFFEDVLSPACEQWSNDIQPSIDLVIDEIPNELIKDIKIIYREMNAGLLYRRLFDKMPHDEAFKLIVRSFARYLDANMKASHKISKFCGFPRDKEESISDWCEHNRLTPNLFSISEFDALYESYS